MLLVHDKLEYFSQQNLIFFSIYGVPDICIYPGDTIDAAVPRVAQQGNK